MLLGSNLLICGCPLAIATGFDKLYEVSSNWITQLHISLKSIFVSIDWVCRKFTNNPSISIPYIFKTDFFYREKFYHQYIQCLYCLPWKGDHFKENS